jgi:hypothetical protein
MKFQRLLPAMLVLALISCDKEPQVSTRTFYMGFTPFPYAASLEAVNYTYERISADADIVDHHFDNGVPWVEAFEDRDFHPNIMTDWSYRKQHTPLGHKIYVSVAALSVERNTIAKYRSEFENMALPEPWSTYGFNNEEVKVAYLNYCKRIINFFNPDYFNMNVEANLLYFFNPASWSDFMNFQKYIYTNLKTEYPTLKIFSSVTGAHMLPGFIDGNDHVQQKLAVMQVLEYSDLYALSFYPYISSYGANPYPENIFNTLMSVSDKPFAFAETGYAAQTLKMNIMGNDITIASDLEKQDKYMRDLLRACQERKAEFVINFALRDYDSLYTHVGSYNNISIVCRDSGLIDEVGKERASFTTWKNFWKRTIHRE